MDGFDDSWLKVKDDALRLLSFRPRSVAELKKRLLMKKHSSVLIDKTVALMTEQGLLNDERFAKMFAQSKAQSQVVGRNKIRQDLVQKGISNRLIEGAIASIDGVSEKEAALELAQKRQRLMREIPLVKQKVRLLGLLRRRGFSGEAVSFALNRCFKNLEDFE